MCSDFIIQKPSHTSYPDIMKLKREGATIIEYYEYVEHSSQMSNEDNDY